MIAERIISIENQVKEFAKARKIQILFVTKSASLNQIQEVYDLGYREFAESRVQDLLEKKDLLAKDISWHFIGPLQSNKVGKILGHTTLIHSVHNEKLAEKIALQSAERGMVTSILLQVNTSGEESKQGFTEEECIKVFTKLKSLKGIHIQGLMTMAPLTEKEEEIRTCFRKLYLLRDHLCALIGDKKDLPILSMGMSEDYPIALQEGATHLRIGSAIFGEEKG